MRKNITVGGHSYAVEYPDRCPICHHFGDIRLLMMDLVEDGNAVEILYRCPFAPCTRHFIGRYGRPALPDIQRLLPTAPVPSTTSPTITALSPGFIAIYQEAAEANQVGLRQISGPGYRKAFEFLVKDYAKSVAPTERHAEIESAFSAKVVSEFVADPRIAAVAKRALWLGNDETHYLRMWQDKDVNDLITLIRLTIHWIEIERQSAKYIAEMPE